MSIIRRNQYFVAVNPRLCSPFIPLTPGSPFRPEGPCMPFCPFVPGFPLRPGGPSGPGGPAGPDGPCIPIWPGVPGSPLKPAGPVLPGFPFSPVGPAGPGGPGGPCKGDAEIAGPDAAEDVVVVPSGPTGRLGDPFLGVPMEYNM